MTDIVERLAGPFMAEPAALKAMDKAAAEIERLRAALDRIANCEPHHLGEWIIILARAALAEEKPND